MLLFLCIHQFLFASEHEMLFSTALYTSIVIFFILIVHSDIFYEILVLDKFKKLFFSSNSSGKQKKMKSLTKSLGKLFHGKKSGTFD